MAQVPSDEAIRHAIIALLPTIDLEVTGLKRFVKLLAVELGCHPTLLTSKREFVKSQLTLEIHRLQDAAQQQGEDDSEDDAASEDEDDDDDESDDDESDDDESEAPKGRRHAPVTVTPPKKKASSMAGSGGGGGGGGLSTPKELSPALATFLNRGPMLARTDVVKALWEYIREHNLQNPSDKRQILLDGPMQNVFGCDSFTMFTMNKYIGAHMHPFKPVDNDEATGASKRKRTTSTSTSSKTTKKTRKGSSKAAATKKKPRKAGAQPPYRLSDELQAVVGFDALPRPQVVSKLWEYIKANNLQNPTDKREILCDSLLRKVMGNKSKVTMFNMNQHITPHLLEKVDRDGSGAGASNVVAYDNDDEPSEDDDDDGNGDDDDASTSFS